MNMFCFLCKYQPH